ncbi:DUF317 domain-containing protein [Streptomyces sp. NPDC056716]|uniref:DUF317 domain-containing protein n=1 Tax=unclassified Streptomyces TaxID=2593676 RepID=UPI0036C076B5
MNDSGADSPLYATTPRFLAGPGDVRLVTRTLRAAGWTSHCEADTTRLTYTSPTGESTVALRPAPSSVALWWHLSGSHEGRPWTASFGGNLPAEILAEVLQALADPQPRQPAEPWSVLTAAGWQRTRDDYAWHPSQTLRLHRVDTADPAATTWLIDVSTPHGSHFWDGELDSVPLHLVTAFATALARDAPALRARSDVPDPHSVTQTAVGTHDIRHAHGAGTRSSATTSTDKPGPPPTTPGARGPLR